METNIKKENSITIKNVKILCTTTEEYLKLKKENPNEIPESIFCPETITDEHGRKLEIFCISDENGKTIQYYKFSGNY